MNEMSTAAILDNIDYIQRRLGFVLWLYKCTGYPENSPEVENEMSNVIEENLENLVNAVDVLGGTVAARLTAPAAVRVKKMKV